MQVLLPIVLALPLSLLGGRFHDLVRELDQALRRERAARTEAEHANRARDEFLAVLSHELRSPLNAIVGWAHVLKGRSQTPDNTHAVDTILRNADHQVRLISEITDLSRGITGKLLLESGVVDVRAVLDQAVDTVRLSATGRGVAIQLSLAESPLLVHGDPARLRQVFWNLLSNAVQVQRAGRGGPGLCRRSRRPCGGEGGRRRAGHRPASSCRTSSRSSVRRTPPRAVGRAGWESAWPSCAI